LDERIPLIGWLCRLSLALIAVGTLYSFYDGQRYLGSDPPPPYASPDDAYSPATNLVRLFSPHPRLLLHLCRVRVLLGTLLVFTLCAVSRSVVATSMLSSWCCKRAGCPAPRGTCGPLRAQPPRMLTAVSTPSLNTTR
jgi:hypothetical protein